MQCYLPTTQELEVGRLGKFQMPQGDYYYMGSAWGPGGLRARVTRHLVRAPNRQHWHIDWLSRVAVPQAIYYLHVPADQLMTEIGGSVSALECIWSQALVALRSASIPAPRFGSSDCRARCRAHLVAFAGSNNPIKDPVAIRRHLAIAVNISIDHIKYNQIRETSKILLFDALLCPNQHLR